MSLIDAPHQSGIAGDALPLFDFCGMKLPRQVRSNPIASLRPLPAWTAPTTLCGRPLHVTVYVDACPGKHLVQPDLPLVPRRASNVVHLVPPRSYIYLDYGVYDYFRDVKELRRPAAKIERAGLYMLGHLVQMTEPEVRRLSFMNDRLFHGMRAELAIARLGFGAVIPTWNRKHRYVPERAPSNTGPTW